MTAVPPQPEPATAASPRDERNLVRTAATVISAVGAVLGPLGLLAFPGLTSWRPEDLPGAGALIPALVFLASPFAGFLLAARLSRTKAGAAVVAVLALVAALVGALIYGDAVVRKNFVLLLLFAGVPMLQWLMALPALVAALVLRGRNPSPHRS